MKALLIVGGVLALAAVATTAYVLYRPSEDSAPASRANDASSAAKEEPTPAMRKLPPKQPLVRPPTSATTLEIGGYKENEDLINELGNYPNLEVLKLKCLENLQVLPDSIGALSKLREFDMDEGNGCAMNPVIPESIGNLQLLEKLNLTGAQDPRDVGEYETRSRERHKFPAGMSRLSNLTYLSLGRNGMPEIPPFVKDLPKLEVLDFSWNMEAKEIPVFLTNLQELTTLRLDADGLTDLPDFLAKLPRLTKISLGDNCSITQDPAKRQDLQRRFPKITFDFEDEYVCSQEEPSAKASPSK